MDLSSLGLKVGRGCHVRGPWVGLLDVDVLVGSVLLLHHDVWGLGDEGRATDFLVCRVVVSSVVLVEGAALHHLRGHLGLDGCLARSRATLVD